MTPEEKRITIAEFCGFIDIGDKFEISDGITMNVKSGYINGKQEMLPDYLNDLNAMHEAEKKLNPKKWVKISDYESVTQTYLFCIKLCQILEIDDDYENVYYMSFEALNATALQRADALLMTIGKL